MTTTSYRLSYSLKILCTMVSSHHLCFVARHIQILLYLYIWNEWIILTPMNVISPKLDLTDRSKRRITFMISLHRICGRNKVLRMFSIHNY